MIKDRILTLKCGCKIKIEIRKGLESKRTFVKLCTKHNDIHYHN